MSLTIREEFEDGIDSVTRPVNIWVRDPNSSRTKKLIPKGLIRENEPPNTIVHFSIHNEAITKASHYARKSDVADKSTLSSIISKTLPRNVVKENLILKNLNIDEDESVPFTISFNKSNEDGHESSLGKFEIRSSAWLDYEKTPSFKIGLLENELNERSSISNSLLNLTVDVVNVNDNLPVFKSNEAVWRFPSNARRYMVIGKAVATDADGDEIIYEFRGGKKVVGNGCCIIVPKTGEIMLVETPFVPTHIAVVAREKNAPSRRSRHPMTIALIPDDEMENEILMTPSKKLTGADYFLDYVKTGGKELIREKRHVTRAVRPTKRTEFTEADGQPAGKVVFRLEKESEHEKFKIRDENPWVTVEPNGSVRVKKRWDYEELGREKTIDFWVIISNVRAEKWKSAVPYTDNQRVIIRVKDVNDEPPYFINRPLPMQAVVKLNAAPNSPVFTLQAKDPDTDHNLHYFLVRDRTGGRFEVDERSGVVRTRGKEAFQLDMEYVLYVKAEDQNGREGRKYQSTPEERLSIVGGKRPPQFYMPSYEAEIPESQRKDSDIISVKAKSFADREIRYTLKAQGQGAGTFNIGPSSGIVKLAKELDFEDLRQPHIYQLLVTATEDSGGFSTSVEVRSFSIFLKNESLISEGRYCINFV